MAYRFDLRGAERTVAARTVRWLGNGRLVCSLTDGGRTDLWLLERRDGGPPAPERLTAGGIDEGDSYAEDVDPFDVVPGTESVLFAASAATGGGIREAPTDGSAPSAVLEGPGTARSPRAAGDAVVFVTDRWGPDDVAVASDGGRVVENLTDDGWYCGQPAPSPDGAAVAHTANRVQDFTDDHEIRVVERATGAVRTVAGGADAADAPVAGDAADARHPAWSPDGETLYFASDGRGHADLYRWDRSGGGVERLTGGDAEDYDPRVHPDGGTVAFTRECRGTADVAVLDVDSGGVSRVTGGDGVAHRARWSPGGSLAYVHEDASTPPVVRTRTAPDAPPADQTLAGTAALRAAAVEPERVAVEASDGTEVPSLLYRGRGAGNGAGLVFVHGGPMKTVRDGWNPRLQYLADRGFAVVAPNVRGSTGHGREHRRAAYGDWDGAPLADVVAAARYLGDLDGVDPDRLGVWGPSFGGYATVLALARHPELFAAGVCLYGTPDYEEYYNDHDDPDLAAPYWEQDHPLAIRLMLRHFGPIAEDRETYVGGSPVHDVGAIEAPLLVLQGMEDPGVLPGQAETLVAALERHGVVHEYRAYEGQGHGFTGPAFVDAYSRTAAFFEKYLTIPPETP